MMFHMVICSVLMIGGVLANTDQGLLPLDGRWDYPHYLTFRPGNGQVCQVNPPRFSWPYVPQVVTGEISVREFIFQLSRTGNFSEPDMEIRTPLNFYNALPVLEDTEWHWRVGYKVETEDAQWSPVRTFTFAPDAVEWDRTAINDALRMLKDQEHPRLAPLGNDWASWVSKLKSDGQTAKWLKDTLDQAQRVMKSDWWQNFPKTDRKGESKYNCQQFMQIASELAITSFAYRLTGDERYLKAKEHALALAKFPKGGLASPEFHGAPRKWPTRITEYLALCFDWLYEELTEEERGVILNSIDWRLRATYLEKASWRAGKNISCSGVSVFCGSHPYENFMWSMPAVLLTAGELAVSEELLPLCLNYLTGVTSAHGPDEAWNEGLAYGSWKGQTMLGTSMYVALLLPELNIGKNPFYRRLGEWYAHLMPLGIQRLSFGDYAANPKGHRKVQRDNARVIGWLTGDGRFLHRYEALAEEVGRSLDGRSWLHLLFASDYILPEPLSEESDNAVFPEAGWVMVNTGSHSDRDEFEDAVGMIFQCRPRGGFSHSFRAENDFVWHAYGQTLSAGGGGAYPDPYSRNSLGHNVILVNGIGQEWKPQEPKYPFVGRLIAHHEGNGYVHWVGDATHAYQTVPGLLRWHRHVVFVDEKWFAIFDDLAMRPEADPAKFSWLFHVAPKVPLTIEDEGAGFSYRMENVHARVAFANDSHDIEISDMQGREGFKNLITGHDLYPEAVERLASKEKVLRDNQWIDHNLWVTNREPAREFTFLSSLVAWRDGEAKPDISFEDGCVARVSWPDGISQSVSFDPEVSADVVVDLEAVRDHALSTEPEVLPPNGRVETVEIDEDTYQIEWLATETFDRADWMSRWFVEGDSEVKIKDGKLWVRELHADKANVATIWFRPELPADVFVRFRAKVVPPSEKNAANLNLFLHGRELDGSPVQFGRNGQYSEYHKFPNYIVTFTGGFREGWSRARRDPGFNLLHEADVRSEVGDDYEIVVAMQKGRLRYYINGLKMHDVQDADPLPGGRFGIRTWSTNAWWDDVEFGKILTR